MPILLWIVFPCAILSACLSLVDNYEPGRVAARVSPAHY
jgi:hypothetical protein